MPPINGTALVRHISQIPQPHGGALNSGGTPGHVGGTGRPGRAAAIRRQAIVARSLDEQMRILDQSQKSPVPLVELNELTQLVSKYDDELRIKQVELAGEARVIVKVVRE
jgi:hypothetical protein